MSNLETMNQALRKAFPPEWYAEQIALCEEGLGKFDQWMEEMDPVEREALITGFLADDARQLAEMAKEEGAIR